MNGETLQLFRDYVVKNSRAAFDTAELDADSDMIAMGIVDSLMLLQMINFAEDTFDISVDPDEVTFENFGKLSSIVTMVEGKLAQKASG